MLKEAWTVPIADEDCFARTEDGLVILEPLLDLPREDDDHLFLVGVRVEVVAVARLERHVEHRELPRTGGRRPADPAEPSPVELLALDVGFVDEPSAHTRSPSRGVVAIALKRATVSVSATSVGSRSMLEAPKNPTTPRVRSST